MLPVIYLELWTVKDKLPVIGLNNHFVIHASRRIANTDFWFLCAKYSLAFTGFTKAILIHAREEVESLA